MRSKVDKKLTRTAAQRNADLLRVCDHVLALFTKRLALPMDDPEALRPGDLSVREMVELAKLVQLVQGGATDRHAVLGGDADRKSLAELEQELEDLWTYELERIAAEADAEKRQSEEQEQ